MHEILRNLYSSKQLYKCVERWGLKLRQTYVYTLATERMSCNVYRVTVYHSTDKKPEIRSRDKANLDLILNWECFIARKPVSYLYEGEYMSFRICGAR